MQKLILLLALFTFNIGILISQEVNETMKSMSLGKQTAFQIDIDGADEDMTEDVWKDFIKDYGKSKRNKKAREYYSIGARIPLINGSGEVDVYMRIDEKVGLTTATFWADLGSGFVNSNDYPKEAQGAEDFMIEFYLAVKKEAISEEMKEQEKMLKKMDKNLRKLEKKNSNYHKNIEKAKKKIEEAELDIEQNLREQEDQRISIEQQKKVLEEIILRLNNLGKN